MIVNMSVVIVFVKSFAIIIRKEAEDGPYLKKSGSKLKKYEPWSSALKLV